MKVKTAHQCKSNCTGSSGGMELAGVAAIFNRSMKQYGVRYTQYLGDGDSQGLQHVVSLKLNGNANTNEMLECEGHVQKRVGARLQNLHGKTKTVFEDGKNCRVSQEVHLMSFDVLQTYYGNFHKEEHRQCTQCVPGCMGYFLPQYVYG